MKPTAAETFLHLRLNTTLVSNHSTKPRVGKKSITHRNNESARTYKRHCCAQAKEPVMISNIASSLTWQLHSGRSSFRETISRHVSVSIYVGPKILARQEARKFSLYLPHISSLPNCFHLERHLRLQQVKNTSNVSCATSHSHRRNRSRASGSGCASTSLRYGQIR